MALHRGTKYVIDLGVKYMKVYFSAFSIQNSKIVERGSDSRMIGTKGSFSNGKSIV